MKKYNKQGIRLIDDQLLVLFDKVDDVVQEIDIGGGKKIYTAKSLDRETADKEKLMAEASATFATIIDISPAAYLDLDDAEKPAIGDRLYMSRHCGEFITAKDGVKYKIIREAEVICFINF